MRSSNKRYTKYKCSNKSNSCRDSSTFLVSRSRTERTMMTRIEGGAALAQTFLMPTMFSDKVLRHLLPQAQLRKVRIMLGLPTRRKRVEWNPIGKASRVTVLSSTLMTSTWDYLKTFKFKTLSASSKRPNHHERTLQWRSRTLVTTFALSIRLTSSSSAWNARRKSVLSAWTPTICFIQLSRSTRWTS